MAFGALAGALMVVTEFSDVAVVEINQPAPDGTTERFGEQNCELIVETQPELRDRCQLSGFERHGGAFLLLGLLAIFMAWGAGAGMSRPAAMALIAIGVIVLLWSLIVDLPETNETGLIGSTYSSAEGRDGPGLYMEIVGGLLTVGAGGLRLRAGSRP